MPDLDRDFGAIGHEDLPLDVLGRLQQPLHFGLVPGQALVVFVIFCGQLRLSGESAQAGEDVQSDGLVLGIFRGNELVDQG